MDRVDASQEILEEIAALAMHGFLHTAMIEARQSGADEKAAQQEAWEQFCHVAPRLSAIVDKAVLRNRAARSTGSPEA